MATHGAPGHEAAIEAPGQPVTPASLAHDAEIDLAHGLPDWDLLPPSEFVRRRPDTGR
jgi:hypothetical protein